MRWTPDGGSLAITKVRTNGSYVKRHDAPTRVHGRYSSGLLSHAQVMLWDGSELHVIAQAFTIPSVDN